MQHDFEQMEPDEVFACLRAFLREPDTLQRHTNRVATTISGAVSPFFQKHKEEARGYPIGQISEEAWQRCYDPAMPTIGFRALDGSGETALLAIAAQRLRQRGEQICNVVMLHEPAYDTGGIAEDGAGNRAFFSCYGAILDADGLPYVGSFGQAVQIDVMRSNRNERLWDKLDHSHFINTPSQQDAFENKYTTHEQADAVGLPRSEILLADAAAADPALRQLIEDSLANNTPIVIKPVDGSLGSGVIMVRSDLTDSETVMAALRDEPRKDIRYIVERWIETPPLHANGGGGTRLDWNIRALVVDGEPALQYARLGRFGDAINISRAATAVTLDGMFERYGLADEERAKILGRIALLCSEVGRAYPNAGFIGTDIILDQKFQPFCIEENGENSGGLTSTMRITSDGTDEGVDWTYAENIIRKLHDRHFSGGRTPRFETDAGYDVIQRRDILNGLAQLDVGAQANNASKLIDALQRVHGSLGAPGQRTVDSIIADFELANRMRLPSEQDYAESFNAALLGVELRIGSDMTTTLEPLNRYLAHDPHNLRRQRNACVAAIWAAGCRDMPEFIAASAYFEAQTTPNAEALGKALCTAYMYQTQTAPHTVGLQAFSALSAVFSEYLQQPPENRFWPANPDLPGVSDREKKYLARYLQYVYVDQSLRTGNFQELTDTLKRGSEATSINSTDNDTINIAYTVNQWLDKKEGLSLDELELGQYAAMNLYGLLQALYLTARITEIDENAGQKATDRFCNFLDRLGIRLGFEVDGPEHNAFSEELIENVFAIASTTSSKDFINSFAKLAASDIHKHHKVWKIIATQMMQQLRYRQITEASQLPQ